MPSSRIKIKRRGFMLVLSSPSGGGKTTLSRLLLQNDHQITLSTSATTRAMRPGEVDGVDYFFLTPEQFQAQIEQDAFMENEQVFGHRYGTPKAPVLEHLEHGTDVLFDIDWQGTRRITNHYRNDVVSIFILPPSLEELERRLRSRGADSEETIRSRMDRAKQEISHWNEYDYVIINEDIDRSLSDVIHILKAERLRRVRQHRLNRFTHTLLA